MRLLRSRLADFFARDAGKTDEEFRRDASTDFSFAFEVAKPRDFDLPEVLVGAPAFFVTHEDIA